MTAICIFLLVSCFNNKENAIILTPKKEIQVILDSLVQKNVDKNYSIYELYIDKLDPVNCEMLLYAGNTYFIEEPTSQPLAYTICNGITIGVYSGAECYFENPYSKRGNYIRTESEKQMTLYAIKDSCGYLHAYEILGGYPFVPPPLENKDGMFTVPEIIE